MKKNNKIVATILVATTLNSSLILSFADTKGNSQKTKQEMSVIKSEKESISKKTQALENKISTKNNELNKIKANLESILKRKIENEKLLQQINEDLKIGVSQLKEQASTYYINSYSSNTTALETFIKSESISDYIITSNHLKFVVEEKDKNVEEVRILLEEQKKIKKEIKKDEEELTKLQTKLNSEIHNLEKTKTEYISETKALDKKYTELEDILIVQQEEEERIKKQILASQEAAKKEEAKKEESKKEEVKNESTSSASTNTQNNSSTSTSTQNTSGWITPLKSYSRITSYFGNRIHPVTGKYSNHGGMDIAAPTGTPVYSAKSGKVITSEYSGSYGNYIIVSHSDGYATLYAHLSERSVSVGTQVSSGQKIGAVGSTGRSTGPHLHLELRKNGNKVDPLSKIKF